jgi:hypothetical protein
MDYSKYSKLINANKEAEPESFNEIKEKAIVDAIRNGDKNLGIPKRTENEELALLRKAVKLLYEVVSTLHKGEIDDERFTEFAKYYSETEALKENKKDELR